MCITTSNKVEKKKFSSQVFCVFFRELRKEQKPDDVVGIQPSLLKFKTVWWHNCLLRWRSGEQRRKVKFRRLCWLSRAHHFECADIWDVKDPNPTWNLSQKVSLYDDYLKRFFVCERARDAKSVTEFRIGMKLVEKIVVGGIWNKKKRFVSDSIWNWLCRFFFRFKFFFFPSLQLRQLPPVNVRKAQRIPVKPKRKMWLNHVDDTWIVCPSVTLSVRAPESHRVSGAIHTDGMDFSLLISSIISKQVVRPIDRCLATFWVDEKSCWMITAREIRETRKFTISFG